MDGDGYSDVIVGALMVDGELINEGRAYVYHGIRLGGLSSSQIGLLKEMIERSSACSVGTAGDVNGDGYSDVIVGATGFDNRIQ